MLGVYFSQSFDSFGEKLGVAEEGVDGGGLCCCIGEGFRYIIVQSCQWYCNFN